MRRGEAAGRTREKRNFVGESWVGKTQTPEGPQTNNGNKLLFLVGHQRARGEGEECNGKLYITEGSQEDRGTKKLLEGGKGGYKRPRNSKFKFYSSGGSLKGESWTR